MSHICLNDQRVTLVGVQSYGSPYPDVLLETRDHQLHFFADVVRSCLFREDVYGGSLLQQFTELLFDLFGLRTLNRNWLLSLQQSVS